MFNAVNKDYLKSKQSCQWNRSLWEDKVRVNNREEKEEGVRRWRMARGGVEGERVRR